MAQLCERIGLRTFTQADQERFAELSGDRNPFHLDAVVARRTQAGAPVVHGMHTLLWCLDLVASLHSGLPPVAAVKVRFDRLIHPGDPVEAVVVRRDASRLGLEARARETTALRLSISFGPLRPAPAPVASGLATQHPEEPLDLSFESTAGRAGRVAFATAPDAIAATFPAAARCCGARRIAALACLSRIVGMVCPGLHSIFGGLTLSFSEETAATDQVEYRATVTDPRFRVVRLAVSGGGVEGSVETFARQPPVEQLAMRDVARVVGRGAFAGTSALVVGGSRGLGEVTAKLLAAGDARVTITYAVGRADAERVRSEITAFGASCEAIRYDAQRPAGEQLQLVSGAVDRLYYFATPTIFHQGGGSYRQSLFMRFCAFYIDAFHDLWAQLWGRTNGSLRAFYPSSIAVETRPPGMTEYAMAKAAGEVLCADLNAQASNRPIIVGRLPRLLTDQTATLTQVATAHPAETLLPFIHQVQTAN